MVLDVGENTAVQYHKDKYGLAERAAEEHRRTHCQNGQKQEKRHARQLNGAGRRCPLMPPPPSPSCLA